MEKIHARPSAIGRRSEYRASSALRKRRALLAALERKKISVFMQGVIDGIDMPLSLSVPKVERERLNALMVKTNSRGQASDRIKLNGDIRRAVNYAVKAAR
jgi:hypothetical protein